MAAAEPAAHGPGRLRRSVESEYARPLILIVAVFVLWEVVIDIFQIKPYLIPSPWSVARMLVTEWPRLWREGLVTAYATLGGFALSIVLGIPIAMAIAYSRTMESYVYPLMVFSQSIPKIAIAPLFVVWFGFGIIPKVISAFLLGFFPVVVSAVQGFKSVDPDMVDLARAMQGSRFQVFCAVNLPHALPAIFSGLKVSVTLAVVGAVVGEFVGSNSGIGYVMQRSIGTFDLPTMFAALVILALLGVILFWIVDRIEKLVIPWHVSQREDVIFAS
jgi:NitT/TauT family transport system permease protein